MAVQVNQASKTSDFTNQYSSAQKTQQADGSNFMTFLKDARKLDNSSQDSNQAEEKLFGDEVKESADVPAAELLVDEASVEMPGRFNPDQNEASQDQSTELMTALLMGGFVAPENADQTVAQELGQEMTREMSLGAVQNPDATTILSSIMANQDGKVTEMPVLAEEAFSDDLTSQLENTLVGQDVDLLNKQKTKLDSALRQVKESTEVITDDARADQPLGRTDQISVESQEKSAEAGKTISLNGIDLQEETVEAPSVETDGKQVDVQSLLGVKSTAPATKAEPAQLLSQVQDAIVENFELNTDKTFKVTLNPESLGEIDVEMAFSNGKLTINILAASQETHELLSKQIDQLVRSLALQKVSVETVTINRSVEETADSGQQAQSNMTNMDFKQGQQQEAQSNLIGGKFNRMARIGLTSGESLDESLTDLANISVQSSRFSRLNYLV
ncbi:MAG: flagellar hook-length control protein FliK [Eubacteriaceae bacterium]|jgi:flagellar hook-length control protein FliK|nr:flagellar hook-length control protein FliK [Eubacteriaceae bacterium]